MLSRYLTLLAKDAIVNKVFTDFLSEINPILNCRWRYESEHDLCSRMNNLSGWKRTWKYSGLTKKRVFRLVIAKVWVPGQACFFQVLFQPLRLFILLCRSCSFKSKLSLKRCLHKTDISYKQTPSWLSVRWTSLQNNHIVSVPKMSMWWRVDYIHSQFKIVHFITWILLL